MTAFGYVRGGGWVRTTLFSVHWGVRVRHGFFRPPLVLQRTTTFPEEFATRVFLLGSRFGTSVCVEDFLFGGF